MKIFSDQLRECKALGLTKETEFVSFKEHPEWLPAFPHRPKLKKMMKAIETGELKGIDFIVCGKFGGRCSSKHEECRELRKKL